MKPALLEIPEPHWMPFLYACSSQMSVAHLWLARDTGSEAIACAVHEVFSTIQPRPNEQSVLGLSVDNWMPNLDYGMTNSAPG
jgi:hypothetical protein